MKNISALNEWLSLLANIGVIAGIVFLGLEISQNSRMMEAQTRAQISQSITGLIESDRNPDVVEALLKLRDGEELNGKDSYFLESRARLFLRSWENTYYQYENGLLSEEDFDADYFVWRSIMRAEHFRDEWLASRESYPSGFRDVIDSLVD